MNFCKKHLFILLIVFFVTSIIFWGQSSNFLIDFSREISIPTQMLNNQKLFCDIFLIYGFWGYFLNGFLFKIANSVNILLFEAVFISYFIILLFYGIACRFAGKIESFLFSLALIFCSIFSCATFSFVVPYSFSALWGYFGAYLLLFSILYKKDALIFLSLGLILVSKIELFVPLFIFVLLYKTFCKEKFSFKIFYIFIFPFFFLFYLIFNKIQYSSILDNLFFIKKMTHTEALNYFYSGMGVFFQKDYFFYNLKTLGIVVFIIFLAFYLYNIGSKKFKILSYFILSLLAFIPNYFTVTNLAVFVLVALFITALLKKKVEKNDIILFSFSIILSLKSLFALNIFSYGNFSCILVLLNIYLLLKLLLKEHFDFNFLKITFIFFISFLALFNLKNILIDKKIPYKTDFGTLFINRLNYTRFVELNNFIRTNLSDKDSMVVLPEGQIFNYLNNKKWEFYNTTFTPLDFETFGDDFFIDKLKKTKIDYVIFYPRDTKDYKKNSLCRDYGVDFCKFIVDNYSENDILKKYSIIIYKKKYET